jgi:signal transduction histidine kinase
MYLWKFCCKAAYPAAPAKVDAVREEDFRSTSCYNKNDGLIKLNNLMRIEQGKNRLLYTIIGTAAVLTIIIPVLALSFDGRTPVMTALPWVNSVVFTVIVTTSLMITFVSFIRFHILGTPTAFWISLAFASFSLGAFFYITTYPGLLLDGQSILAKLPNTSAWIGMLSQSFFIGLLFAAVFGSWPSRLQGGEQASKLLFWGLLALLAIVCILSIAVEQLLPGLVTPWGEYLPLLRGWEVVSIGLVAILAALTTRSYIRQRDTILGLAALYLVIYFYATIAALLGTQRYDFWWMFYRILAVGGSLVVGMGILSEQGRLLQQVRDGSERFRVALENSSIAAFQLDRSLKFTWAYIPAFEQSGLSLIGKRVTEMPLHGMSPDLVKFLQSVIDSGQPKRKELTGQTSGKREDLILTGRPVFGAGGEVNGLIGAIMDISEIRLLEAQKIENEVRVQVQRRLLDYQEKERLQLARELHDQPLQDFLAINMYLGDMLASGCDEQAEKLRVIQSMLMEGIREIRTIALNLRPPILMHLGIEKVIINFVDSFAQQNQDINVDMRLEIGIDKLPEARRLAFYRIFQELMNNIIKHAQASQVFIRLQRSDGHLILHVADNGKGFNYNVDWTDLANAGHLGLIGVRERLEIINGQIEIHSIPSKGTSVKVTVPE